VYGQISALHGLAWLYGLTEQRDAQIGAARLAWKMASDFGDPAETRAARVDLALALSDSGFHSEAVQHMEAVVAETPSAGAIGNLGWVFYQAGDYGRSLKESYRALDVDPAQTWTIRNLGHAYLAKGLPDDAEREYRRAIQDRKGGENFIETIRILTRILSQKSEVSRGREMLQLLEEEQRKLEAEEKSVGASGSS
jgi:tetratricopeptide (TPR) repeat protein